jgi:DNA transposition AAA+ family ATPase
MAQDRPLYNTIAALGNVHALTELVERLRACPATLPRLGVFHGNSGFGKTTAAIYAANVFGAAHVQCKSYWTKKTLTEAILAELGATPGKTISTQVDQICERLAVGDLPLIVDEADFLVSGRKIEIVRDIYEGSGAPVVLIGEELLPQRLTAWERVHGRVLSWVAAMPAAASDVDHLCPIYARGIEIGPDMRRKLLKVSHGSIRRICVNLNRIAEFARTRGLAAVDLDIWGDEGFYTGEAPRPRGL